jgi:nucleoporin SEH1
MGIEPKNSGRRWIERARLVDSRGSVQDIEFAPHHHGLQLVYTHIYYLFVYLID